MPASPSAFDDALAALPHGEGFRFVDALTHLEPGVTGTGTYQVTGKEDFLRGHFPGKPMVPAVIMVEALAQLGGVVAQSDPRSAHLSNLRLTALKNVKVFDAAYPGYLLELRTRVSGRLGNLIQLEGQVIHDGTMLMAAQITLTAPVDDTEPVP